MAFPTSPSNGDEYTNALGTIYKYLTADDKWYIISAPINLNDLTEKNHVSLAAKNGEADIQHLTAAQVTALHAVEDKTRTILMELTVNNGATIFSYGIDVDANGEGWSMGIKLPSNIDASSDIKITYTWRCQANNTVVILKRWVSATKTDGSEVQAWNIVSAQVFNSSPSPETNMREYTETYTIGNANFDSGDMILMLVRSFEVGVDQIVKNAILEYEVV